MKRYLTLLILLFFTLGAVESRNLPPAMDDKFHVMDVYESAEIIHHSRYIRFIVDHSPTSTGYHKLTYTFTINSHPTLIMANAIDSERKNSIMELYYKPFNSTESFKKITSAASNFIVPEVLRNKDRFGVEFEEDLTIPLSNHYPVLYYDALQPGEYELVCRTPNDPDIPDGLLRTNIYLSPIGVNEDNAIEIGNFTKNFSAKTKLQTFGGGDIFYKFHLDSINMISITPQGPTGKIPLIELINDGGSLVSSDQYPLTGDLLPQIKDGRCGVGTNYVRVHYADSTYAKVGLNIAGIVNNAGSSWTCPFEMGNYADSLYYENCYNTYTFIPTGNSSTSSVVYHRFSISNMMDLSIVSEDNLKNITLYDSSHRILRQVQKEEYLTSLDFSSLSPGTYFFTIEGGWKDVCVKVRGRKPLQQLSDTKNYVATMKASVSTPFILDIQNPLYASQEIQYCDPFGRAEQTIQFGVTPTLKSLVSRKEYDRMYRDSCSWIPIACPGTGNYISQADFKKYALELYNDSYTYEKYIYDNSPLNRLIEKYNPGKDWHTSGHSEKTAYQTNSASSQVRLFDVTGDKGNPSLMQKGFYAAGELVVVEQKDEDGLPTLTFTNKLEQTILSRTISATDTLDTYQVYDIFGNLVFVLPPMAVSSLRTLGQEKVLELYAYQYRYDERNHYSGKKLPGALWTELKYDEKGRLHQIRDGEMKKRNEWKCIFYDRFGREVMIAMYKGSNPNIVSRYIDFAPNESNTSFGYHLNDNFKKDLSIEKITYYDSYQYKSVNSNFNSLMNYTESEGYGHRYGDDIDLIKCKGLVTGVMTRVVGTDQMLCSSTYYDYYHRPVQFRSTDVNGKIQIRNFKYDFAGNVLASSEELNGVSFAQSMTYDHGGRLLKNTHLINSSLSATFLYDYDELGRLKNVTRNNGSKSIATTYKYNLRNWLTSIDSPLFKQNLYYTDGTGAHCYNGNISSMTWKTGNEQITRGYLFEYDPLSRLKKAAYGEGVTLSPKPNMFDEQITNYDKNGNIVKLMRQGLTSANGYGVIDNLTFNLNGNQLANVEDAATASAYNNGFEFKNGSREAIEYSYDGNGNLMKDLNKKITKIEYNYLNLPDRIEFEGGSSVSYLYDAAGTKLRAVHSIAGNTTTTDYCGNVIFENGSPKTVLTEAGYVSLNDNKYHYYLQDHQGNNRVVTDQNGTIEEVNHYYPFGGTFANSSSIQPYKYNGKELDTKNGLNWYDYGARRYDAAIGRWHAVDALSEKYYGISPYTYCLNNPIRLIDPNGMWPGDPLLQPFGRYEYGSNGVVNSFRFIHNTVAAVVNTPINAINNLADEAEFIYNNGVGSYLSSGTQSVGNSVGSQVSYWTKTPLSQQASDTWQAMKDPQNWENVAATAVIGLTPMKIGATSAKSSISTVVKTENTAVESVVHGNSLSSQRPTWGYKLYSTDGTFLKNGITSKKIPEKRYTKSFMSDKYMEAESFSNRKAAWDWEYQQNLNQRGPLNKNMH